MDSTDIYVENGTGAGLDMDILIGLMVVSNIIILGRDRFDKCTILRINTSTDKWIDRRGNSMPGSV